MLIVLTYNIPTAGFRGGGSMCGNAHVGVNKCYINTIYIYQIGFSK